MNEEFRPKPRRNILGEPIYTAPTPKPSRPAEPEAPLPHPKAKASEPLPAAPAVEEYIPPANPRSNRGSKKLILVTGIVLCALGLAAATGSFFYFRAHNKTGSNNSAGSGNASATIAVYYPKNLPPGYVYNNDLKTLKKDVYYFTITGPKKELYYVTQQQLPANFDFTAFNKKFLNPDTYSTESGTVIAGPVGASILGSIRTNKNTWIIINSSETATLAGVEAITRSLGVAL